MLQPPPGEASEAGAGPAAAAPATDEHRRSLRRAAILTATMGIAFSVLFVFSFLLITSVPNARASDDQIREFYTGGGSPAIATAAGLYVLPFSGIAFLWFSVALRMWAAASGRAQGFLQSNLQLISGIVFVVLMFVAAASIAVVATTVEYAGGRIDPATARDFPIFGSSIVLFFAMRMAAMFVFTTSSIGRQSGILPTWFVIVGVVVGLFLLFSATFTPLLVLAFPGWVFVLSLILMRIAWRIPADLLVPRPGESLPIRPR
jgi:hypothetical protein